MRKSDQNGHFRCVTVFAAQMVCSSMCNLRSFAQLTIVILVATLLNSCAVEKPSAENDEEECPRDGRIYLSEMQADEMTEEQRTAMLNEIDRAIELFEADISLNQNLSDYFAEEYFTDGIPSGELKGLEANVKAEALTSHRAEEGWFKWMNSDRLTEMMSTECSDLFVVQVIQGRKKPLYFMCLDNKQYDLRGTYEWQNCAWRKL